MVLKTVARKSPRRGAVMVELAICLPVILIMLAGMANLGSILWQIEQMSDAARHGARLAAARSNNGGTDCDATTLQDYAQSLSSNYVSQSHADPMHWWSSPIPTATGSMTWPATANNPTSFTRRMIKVEFTTGGSSDNCIVCFGQILRRINVRVQAVFALQACG